MSMSNASRQVKDNDQMYRREFAVQEKIRNMLDGLHGKRLIADRYH